MSKTTKPGVVLRSKQTDPQEYPYDVAVNLLKIAEQRRAAGVPDEDNWSLDAGDENYTFQDGKIHAKGNAGTTVSAEE